MITNVYIDGLNLYYRALKSTRLKWLDIRKLSETLFPDDQIHRVSYFTSRLIQRPGHSDQINRQLIYLRALRTLPEVDIYYGKMRLRQMRRPLVAPIPGLPTTVEVESPEEKGTDVNLATRLLMDGFRGEYEQAAIISNDADFAMPMRCVRDDLGLGIVLVKPDPKAYSAVELTNSATRVKALRPNHLRQSQFPATLTDQTGKFNKPNSW